MKVSATEFAQFIWVIAVTLAIAVPITLRKIRLPRILRFETIPDSSLTEKQKSFFAPYDAKLAAMGYRVLFNYRAANLQGKNLLRVYVSSVDPVRCVVQLSAADRGPVQFDHVEFITEYADQSTAVTTNRGMPQTFDCEPDKFLQRLPGLVDLAELKRRHDIYSEQYAARGPVFSEEKGYFAQVQQRYDKQVAHQIERKLLRIDTALNEYRVTLKWAMRMQRYMFNPFADKFTASKLAATLAIGVFPVVVTLEGDQIAQTILPSAANPFMPIAMSFIAYVLAGVFTGMLFRHKSFIWAFVLAFAPTLLFPQIAIHNLGMSLMMGCIADITYRIHGRRARVV